uniref:Helicase C-terminal domain-containing protein n=1 Tax=Timema poppense TaxID=170557 RepID=A0A7R9H6F2_TIMPO|nr:unnamed protein product [Timema poppensis]
MHNSSFISLLDEVKQQLMPIDVQEQDPDISFSVSIDSAVILKSVHHSRLNFASGSQEALNRSEREQYICTHPKMEKLEQVVLAHFQSCKNKGVHTRVMVFAEYRETVVEICHILQQYHPVVKPMKFIGQVRQGKGGFSQKQQIEVMKKFCNGGYNTLVSTCVGEEGLDIGEVDLIVCFDSSSSSVRTKQRIGRTGRVKPECIKLHMTIKPKETPEEQKPKTNQDLRLFMTKRSSGGGSKCCSPALPPSGSDTGNGILAGKAVSMVGILVCRNSASTLRVRLVNGCTRGILAKMCQHQPVQRPYLRRSMETSNCYSTPEELSEFWEGSVPMFGKLPHIDMFWDRSETFNAVSEDFEVDPDKNQVDLSSWHDCQTDLQPTFIVEHSNETENLVALLRRAEEKRYQLIPLTQTARLASQVDTNLLWHRGRGKGRGRWKGRSKRKDVRKGKMKSIQTTLKLGENKTTGNKNLLNGVQEKDKTSINIATPNLSDSEANMLQHCFKTNEDRCPVAEDVVILEEEPDCEILYGISTEDRKLIKEILSNIGETIRNERQQRNPLFLNFPTVSKIFSANKNENKEQRTINFNRKSYPYDINVVMSKGAFEHVDLDVLFSEVNSPKVINYSDNRIILDEPICRAPNCDEFNNVDKRRSDETEVNRSASFIAKPQFDLMLGDLLFEDEEMAEIDDDVSVMKTGAHKDNPISSEKPREIEFGKLVPNISIKENTNIQTYSDCIQGAYSTSVINDGGKDMSASKPLKNLTPILFSPAMMRAGMETEELLGTSPIRCQRSEVTEFTPPTNKFIPPENEPAMSPVLGLQRNSKKISGFSSSTPKLSRKELFSRFDRSRMKKYEPDSSRLTPRAKSCRNMSLASSLKIKPLNVSSSYTSLPKELLGTTKSHDSLDKTPDKGMLTNMASSSSMNPPIISANLGVESPHFVPTRAKPNFDLFDFDLVKLSEGFEENLDSEECFNKCDEENGEKNIKRPTVDSANVLAEEVERKEDHNHDILWNDSDDLFDGLDEVVLAPRQNTTSEGVNPLDDSSGDKAPIKFTSKEDLFNRLGIHPRISEATGSESSSVEESLEKSALHEELNKSNLVSNVKINRDQNSKIDCILENNNITNNKPVHKLSSDEDDASVIQQPRKKKCLLLNSSDEILGEPSHIIGEETEDDDFLSQSILKFKPLTKNINLEKSAIGSVKNSKKQRKVDSKKNPCPFLENEAEVTMDLAQASTDEDSSELDCYDSSFVNDSGNDEGSENELQKKFVHSIIRNPAIGKPALWKRPRSQRQLAFNDLFSQVESEFESSYINDSFCVKGDEASGSEMSDLSELEQAEVILNTKRKGDMKNLKRVNKNVNSKKRRRIILMEESENEDDNSDVRNKVSSCDRIPDLRPHVPSNPPLTKSSREDVGSTHVTEKNTSPIRHLCFDSVAEEIKQRLKGAHSSEDDGNEWLSKSSNLRKGVNGWFSKLSKTNNKCIDIKKSESLCKKVSSLSTLISQDANRGTVSKGSEKKPVIDFSLNNIEWSDEDFDLGSLSKKSAPNRNVGVLSSEATNIHDLLSPFESTKVAGVSNITKPLLTSPQNDVDSLTAQKELKQPSLPVRPKRMEFECCVLVSSSQITCAQEVVVGLRSLYDFEVKVLPMKEADYIVSWRVGVVRKTMTEFLQVPLKQHNQQILQLLRLQFQCPVLIIENDAKHPLPTSNNRTIWTPQGAFDIAALSMATHIRSLFSESKADTARLLASLAEREWNAGHAITLLNQIGMRVIDNKQLVYSNLPGVNSALSLKIYKMYPKISDFILSVRTIKDIQNVTQMDKSTARRLYEALHGRPRLP